MDSGLTYSILGGHPIAWIDYFLTHSPFSQVVPGTIGFVPYAQPLGMSGAANTMAHKTRMAAIWKDSWKDFIVDGGV